MRRFVIATLLLGLAVTLAAVSCRRKPAEPPADVAALAAEAERPRLTPAALAPVLAVNGGPSRLPDALIVQLARPVSLELTEEGLPSDATSLVFEPAVEGRVVVVGPTTLRFEPSRGFAPATAYRARLESVGLADGELKPPEGVAWELSFTTPAFRFERATLTELRPKEGVAIVELAFTGPVEAGEVLRRLRVRTADGESVPARLVTPEDDEATLPVEQREQREQRARRRLEIPAGPPHLVLVRLTSPLLTAGRALSLVVERGVPLAGAVRAAAPEATATIALVEAPLSPEVTIRAANPSEGTSGFFVEIVCDDDAVPERRWYWDPVSQEGFGELSMRCRLDAEDLAQKLSFEPKVAFTIAPSGAGVRVFGDFRRGSYAMKLEPGVRTADRGIVRRPFETTLSVPARTARLSFVSKGRYLPRDQWRALPFRHMNVDVVDVTVRHVRAENLVFWASAEGETTTPRESDVLARTRLAVKGSADELQTSWLDVGSLVSPATRGLLEITLQSGEATDSARLVLTNIQLVAKRETGVRGGNQGGNVRAWAFDAESLEPLSGVHVDLVRPSGQIAGSAVTDSSGEARLEVTTPALPQEPPFALVARKDKDLTYLAFDEVQAEVDDEHVGGETPETAPDWRAALFTDRGVYRPGETAHAVALVRDPAYGPAPADMPVTLRLVDPRGQVLREAPLAVSAAGFATLDLTFADYATTGRHELQLDVAGKRVATHRFHVEEFVPERMEVKVAPQAPQALAGQPLSVAVTAKYLFGGVPADHRAELTCTLEPGSFAPAASAAHHFGPWQDEGTTPRTITLGTSSGVLDAEGRAELSCPTAETGGLGGAGRVITSVAVFEAGGGRTTVGQAAVTLHPERYAVGLAARSAEARAGEPLAVEGVVVDWDGKPFTGVAEVELTLLRQEREYGWWYDESDGSSSHRSYLREVPEGSVKVKVTNGKFAGQLVPSGDATGYVVRAAAGKARTEVRVPGSWSDGWWDEGPGRSADRTPRPGKPAWLPIEGPAVARVGERVTVTLNAPHRGRMLLTAEAERVLQREWKDVEAGPVSWTFELDELRPNVYVSALLVKPPHLESREAFLPDRAYGVTSIRVEPTAYLLPVKLSVPDEIRSGSELSVGIDLGRLDAPAQVVVAAVDEGILSLTKFETPDPAGQVFRRRALGVATYETVGWTLLSSPPPTGMGSGDEALALGRVQSIKPVALWSGLVDVPVSGKAQVKFRVPTYRGKLRVMAIAATPKRMGSAEASVVVRDPLTLQVTLPRFLVENDVAQVPLFVTNASGARRTVEVSLGVEPLDTGGLVPAAEAPELVAVTGTTRTLELADGESGSAVFTLRVKGKAGAVRLTALARAGDIRSTDETEVPLLPTGPRSRTVQRIELAEGETSLTSALAGWEPMSETTTIRVTANPYGDAFDHLKHLIRYPYGCIEQTVSSTRPLLAMQGLAVEVDPKLLASGSIEDRVRSGIDRVLSMQVSSGGFSYWPGGREEAYWGTAYATHLLLDARQAGYVVPDDRLGAALDWMEDRITSHYEKGRQHGDWYSENAEPYMHLVLARAGRARTARAEALLAQVPGESEGHRAENAYMLKAALWLGGDRRFEKDLRAVDVTPISPERRNDWTFYSDRRRRGFQLSTRVDLFGADPQGEKLANLVAEALRAHPSPYYSTQELVWCITGLGKFVGVATTFAPPTLVVGGREQAAAPKAPGAPASDRSWEIRRASERGDVVVRLPSKGEGKVWAIVASEGVRTGAVARAGAEGLTVSRSLFDGAGVPVDPSAPSALGDLVQVVVTIGNTTRERIANVALVDRIPAGWEIENPRLGRGGGAEWLPEDELWNADHVDVRDDRLEVFGHLESGETRKVAYAARAVTAGRFTLPPVEAEAMYDPSIWAREPGGTLQITGPWAPVAQ